MKGADRPSVAAWSASSSSSCSSRPRAPVSSVAVGGRAKARCPGRALAPSPRVLLLDEPLGALDRPLHDQLVRDLGGLFARLGQTTLYITHDVGEAFALGHRVAVIRDGRIAQVATPEELGALRRTPGLRASSVSRMSTSGPESTVITARGSQARTGQLWRRGGRIESPRRATRHPRGAVRGRPPDRLRARRPRCVSLGGTGSGRDRRRSGQRGAHGIVSRLRSTLPYAHAILGTDVPVE